jgi:hypothetical protein
VVVHWGPALVQRYNDAYRLAMGAKHPAGLDGPASAGDNPAAQRGPGVCRDRVRFLTAAADALSAAGPAGS